MQVPSSLAKDFSSDFEDLVRPFLTVNLESKRDLSRSIAPHIQTLSDCFNRINSSPSQHYWKSLSRSKNLALAYLMFFAPMNAYRLAAILCELSRLGYQWPQHQPLKAIDFGAGPCSSLAGLILGSSHHKIKFPSQGFFHCIEQNRSILQLGLKYITPLLERYSLKWNLKPIHHKIPQTGTLLPRKTQRFNLWIANFTLNEWEEEATTLAKRLVECWIQHLEENALVIIIEPALKGVSRKLLEIRRELLRELENHPDFKILTPCLGHQACGALNKLDDWCHEQVMWWRSNSIRTLDDLVGMDHKSLSMSYLVIAKSPLSRTKILPALGNSPENQTFRLVSDARKIPKKKGNLEFYLCGQNGKSRVTERSNESRTRGEILKNVELKGDSASATLVTRNQNPHS